MGHDNINLVLAVIQFADGKVSEASRQADINKRADALATAIAAQSTAIKALLKEVASLATRLAAQEAAR